ncbi:MAG: hypothetical protein K8I02_09185 [Candidatus Methylomirabilis sp.]|nr:hypothetical protein [Deltaproteobacteria bacterium]
MAQLIVDPSDAVNYAERWFKRPPAGVAPKEVLIQSDPGDTTVPVAAQVTLGRSAGLLSEEQARRFVEAGLVFGDETIPTEEQVPGIAARLEDYCVCQDPTGREPTCVAEDFNDIIGTGSDYRDALWAANGGNRSIFTWHLSGRHEYMLAPDQNQSLAALRYTLGAQRQALGFLLEPEAFEPRIAEYEPMCAMNILDFSDLAAIERSLNELDRIFTPICGGCAVRITCGDGCETVRTYRMGPVAGAANAAVWMSPLLAIAVMRRRLKR